MTVAAISKSPASPIAAGSLIVVLVVDGSDTVGTITDSAGNSYTPAGQITSDAAPSWGGNSIAVTMWYVANCKALSTSQSVTYTTTASTYGATMGFISATYDGIIRLDQSVIAFGTGNISIVPGPPSAGGELWVAGVGVSPDGNADKFTLASGWSNGPDAIKATSGAFGQVGGYLRAPNSDTSAKTFAATWTPTRSWAGMLLGFKASFN